MESVGDARSSDRRQQSAQREGHAAAKSTSHRSEDSPQSESAPNILPQLAQNEDAQNVVPDSARLPRNALSTLLFVLLIQPTTSRQPAGSVPPPTASFVVTPLGRDHMAGQRRRAPR